MAKDKSIPIETLRQLLSCNFETGELTWLKRPVSMFKDGKQSALHNASSWNGRHAGELAFITNAIVDYMVGRVLGRDLYAHRVIWALHSGTWPENQIDHIDGCKTNNSIGNLRLATNHENRFNSKKRCNNTSGFKGVTWERRRSHWVAQIGLSGRHIHLGNFTTPEEAHAAYCSAAKKYHGEFGRTE